MFTSEFVIEGHFSCNACTKLVSNRIKKKISDITEISVEMDGKTKIEADHEVTKQELTEVLLGTEYSVL